MAIRLVPLRRPQSGIRLPDALGFNDPPGYYNDNTGAFTVTATPPPAARAMLLSGFLGLCLLAYRIPKRKVTAAV
jgi:hypothetical protein